MPRTARQAANSSVYHAIQRGTGKQILFEDDADRLFYLELLKRVAADEKLEAPVLAWCLMSNHVHLLLQMPLESLSRFMKRVGIAYVRWFNSRHDRVGGLFQNRFMSEPVDDDAYLQAVVRYIHLNPQHAGLANAADWRWSSYGEYVGLRPAEVASTEFVLNAFDGVEGFVEFHQDGGGVTQARAVMDCAETNPMGEDRALVLAKGVLGRTSIHGLAGLPKEQRDEKLVKLRAAGLSVRQIARLTGIGTNIVARAKISE